MFHVFCIAGERECVYVQKRTGEGREMKGGVRERAGVGVVNG